MLNPIQPLITDGNGVERFKANEIVCYLLDNGGLNMNDLAVRDFSREDREQFAQLIGYSWSGASDLSYMSDEVLDAAKSMKDSMSEDAARAASLREQILSAKRLMRDGVAALYGIHPDDLKTNAHKDANMIRMVISRLLRHAFLAGYEAALLNATQEMNGEKSWPHYEPEPVDWARLEKHLSETVN